MPASLTQLLLLASVFPLGFSQAQQAGKTNTIEAVDKQSPSLLETIIEDKPLLNFLKGVIDDSCIDTSGDAVTARFQFAR